MTKQEFYTQHGWKGSNYNSNLTIKDIAAIVRDYVRKAHSDYRFSITSDYCRISVTLMEHPVELVNYEVMKKEVENEHQRWTTPVYVGDTVLQSTLYTEKQIEKIVQEEIQKANYQQLNSYLRCLEWMNPAVLEVLQDIKKLLASYNYDDSDSMIDYFDTNFYVDFNIGKSGKPAKLVARTARKVA